MTPPILTALLTTDTPHHRYFASAVQPYFPWSAILLERRRPRAPFLTAHPFEDLRDEYERETLLMDRRQFGELAPIHSVHSMNDPAAVSLLVAIEPDVVIVFGTGKLAIPVIRAPRLACLNLHGGDPERYRGLDSHLWAIHHNEFEALKTALHHVEAELDTGALVGCLPVPLVRSMGLHELRAASTRICVDLTLAALNDCLSTGSIPGVPQRQRGRYFSFMPAEVKQGCQLKFAAHVSGL